MQQQKGVLTADHVSPGMKPTGGQKCRLTSKRRDGPNCYRGNPGSRLSQVSGQLRPEQRSALPETYFNPPETRQKALGNALILTGKWYWLGWQDSNPQYIIRCWRILPFNFKCLRGWIQPCVSGGEGLQREVPIEQHPFPVPSTIHPDLEPTQEERSEGAQSCAVVKYGSMGCEPAGAENGAARERTATVVPIKVRF